MSLSTPHLCAEPYCTNLVDGPGRCPDHTSTSQRWHQWEQRNHPGAYRAGWTRIRNAYITQHPGCERCGHPAQQVHHRNHNPRDNRAVNLESLCDACHWAETRAYSRRRTTVTR